MVAVFLQEAGRSQQGTGVDVMATGMHLSGDFACVGNLIGLQDGQGVHVCTKRDGFAFALFSLDHSNHPCLGHIFLKVDACRRKLRLDQCAGFKLLKGQFGMGMDAAAQGYGFLPDFLGAAAKLGFQVHVVFLEFLANIVFWGTSPVDLKVIAAICRMCIGSEKGALIGLLLSMVLLGCGKNRPSETSNPSQNTDLSHRQFVLHKPDYDLRLSIGDISYVKFENPTYALKDIDLKVTAPDGQLLLSLKADQAVSADPREVVKVMDFLWHCEDGTEIAGPELLWHITEDPAIRMYQMELMNDKGLLIGSGLSGDLLLRGYIIDHVESVTLWNDVAGGREGYRKGD
jgi:hypothetical protein